MRRIAVAEYERAAFLALPITAAQALNATGAVRVSGTLIGGSTLVEARSTVGAVRVGTGAEAVELHIRPKIGVPRLLWLLGHARDQSGWREDDVQIDVQAGLVAAMATMFAARCRRALSRGILHGYREHEETLPGLRGRLREADQMRARPGITLPLEVRYDDYTSDIVENRMLRSATKRLLTLTGVTPPIRIALTTLDRDLAEVTPLTPGQRLPAIPITRLNQRYAPALQLARLVLERTSVEHRVGATNATGFLFDMNRVYEDWLTGALTARLQAHGGRLRRQQQLALDHDRQTIMQADLTWWTATTCLAVVDAKYKRLHASGPRPEDLYQVLAYCTALRTRSGHLVYAAGSPSPPVVVRHCGVRIHIHVVPLADAPDRVLDAVATIADKIATAATG
jgi:5-methylcytosine-specific restriction enzyme subunit McrC